MIGSGPNGLAAAIVLAQAGLRVEVFEAEAEPGGAARTLPLSLPGFMHDFGSAVHPFAAGSPFFTSLPLADFGLEWVHGEAPLAHPLDDGTAVVLEPGTLAKPGAPWARMEGCGSALCSPPLTLPFARHVLLSQTNFGLRPLVLHSIRLQYLQQGCG